MASPDERSNNRGMHPSTVLLREILEVTAEFEIRLAGELAVNATDMAVMEHLIQQGPLTPTSLSKKLGITTAAMTASIDRLTALDHVTRTPNPSDRRGILVVPSPGSIARAMATLMPMIRGVDSVIASFDESEQNAITAYLAAVVDVYRTHVPGAATDRPSETP